jgi:hypothetical protein
MFLQAARLLGGSLPVKGANGDAQVIRSAIFVACACRYQPERENVSGCHTTTVAHHDGGY